MKKKIAFAVCIIIIIVSVVCFIWMAYMAEIYHQDLQRAEQYNDDNITNLYKFWYAMYICITIFELIVLSGTIYLIIYIYKNDFSMSKEERVRLTEEKQERLKQTKKEKLQKQLEKLDRNN